MTTVTELLEREKLVSVYPGTNWQRSRLETSLGAPEDTHGTTYPPALFQASTTYA